MNTNALKQQKLRILTHPQGEACFLKRVTTRIAEYWLVDKTTDCIVYPNSQSRVMEEGATLDEIEAWLNRPVEAKR